MQRRNCVPVSNLFTPQTFWVSYKRHSRCCKHTGPISAQNSDISGSSSQKKNLELLLWLIVSCLHSKNKSSKLRFLIMTLISKQTASLRAKKSDFSLKFISEGSFNSCTCPWVTWVWFLKNHIFGSKGLFWGFFPFVNLHKHGKLTKLRKWENWLDPKWCQIYSVNKFKPE